MRMRIGILVALLLAAEAVAAPFKYGKVNVGSGTAVLIGSSTTTARSAISWKNPTSSSGTVYCGDSTVTSSTGIPFAPGEGFTYGVGSGAPGKPYCITASGTVNVFYWESY